jgi:Heterokaryon incompatibility protein (HET)
MWDFFLSIIGKADAYLARFIIPYRYPRLRSDLAISDFQFLSTQLPPLDRYPKQILALVLNLALTFVYNPSSRKGNILFQFSVWAAVFSASTLFRWAKNSTIYFHSETLPTRQIVSRQVRSDHMNDEIFRLKTHDYRPYPDKFLYVREYRCLLLKSAKNEDEVIICELFHITHLMATPYYEALSYAWGTKLASRFILVDGKRLSVTENLFSALHHLRRKHCHRLLWVDAICIDQSNLEERSQQVQIMDNIYQNATNVIVWLGPSTPESKLALRYLDFRMQLSHLPRAMEEFFVEGLLSKISRMLPYFWCNDS